MKVRQLFSVLVLIAAVLVFDAPAALAARVVDANVAAGAQSAPDTSWLARVAAACTKYTATTGSDSNGGSAASPWRTIKYSVSQLHAGDTLCVQSGTYNEAHINFTASGQPTLPIAIKAQGAVTIMPASGTAQDQPFFELNTNAVPELAYVLIDGFTLDKNTRDGIGMYLIGGAGVHHIVIQNNTIKNSRAPAGLTIRGRVYNVLVKNNTIHHQSRWMRWDSATGTWVDPQYTHLTSEYKRRDAHAVSIEGTSIAVNGVAQPSVQTIRLERNTLHDNGGDGVQCLGVNDDAGPMTGDPTDIDLVDNRVVNTPGSGPIEENAFDIKSCNQVSIRGSQPPSGQAPGQYSKVAKFLPTSAMLDASGNSAAGEAVVVHYNARKVLIENTRIWAACTGIAIGRSDKKVVDVVIRRNLFFGLRYNQALPSGDASDASRCRGRAVQITNADNVDLYHNTFDAVPTTAVQVGDPSSAGIPNNVDIWNNIFVLSNTVGTEPRYWINIPKEGSSIDSDYNVFWHQDGTAAGDNHFAIAGARYSLAAWQATDRDIVRSAQPRSAWADPLFVANPLTNDYYTQPGSPARDGALGNTGATFCGLRPDIGFLESCN